MISRHGLSLSFIVMLAAVLSLCARVYALEEGSPPTAGDAPISETPSPAHPPAPASDPSTVEKERQMKAMKDRAPDYVHAIWLYVRTGWHPSDVSSLPPGVVDSSDPLTLIIPDHGKYPLEKASKTRRLSGHINRYLLVLGENDKITVDDLYSKQLSLGIVGESVWTADYVWLIAVTNKDFHYSIINDSWDKWLCGKAVVQKPRASRNGKQPVYLQVIESDIKSEQPLPPARPRGKVDGAKAKVSEVFLLAETAGCSGEGDDLPKGLVVYVVANGANDPHAGGFSFPGENEDITKLPHEVCLGRTNAFAKSTLNSFRAHARTINITGTGYWHPYRIVLIARVDTGAEFVEYDRFWSAAKHLSKDATQGDPWYWLSVVYPDTPPEP